MPQTVPGFGVASVRLTKIGRRGLYAVLLVAAAALNTANNLLYLLLGLLVVLYPLSWLLARASLGRLDGRIVLPRSLRAGSHTAAVVRLRRPAGRLGSAALAVRVTAGEMAARAVCPYLEAGGTFVGEAPLRPDRRGPWPVRVDLLSPFPFGLLEARREAAPSELLVLPAPLPGWREPARAAGSKGDRTVLRKGWAPDLLQIRDYVPGEDARFLDWKATARLERPMLREHALEAERRAAVVVDPGLPPGSPREEGEEAVEAAISRAAGALQGLAARGWTLRLVTPDGVVEGSIHAQMEHLARLAYRSAPAEKRFWHSRLEQGESWVYCGADGPRGEAHA